MDTAEDESGKIDERKIVSKNGRNTDQRNQSKMRRDKREETAR